MASVTVRYCGGPELSLLRGRINPHPPSSMQSMIRRGDNKCIIPISMSLSRTDGLVKERTEQKRQGKLSYEHAIDELMKKSVVEIVKNLREEPLLVHVYSDDGNETKIKTEKAVSMDWGLVKSKWEDGTRPLPEGLIFVEQLKNEEADSMIDVGPVGPRGRGRGRDSQESEMTRAWGIVVQARGETCGPSCYLLKTSQGGPLAGMGLCCTHFCLMKVKNFRETAEAQFSKCWLLNGHGHGH